LGKIDQVATLERDTQLRVPQTSAEDRANHLVGIVHFKTGIESSFIHDTIAQYVCDGISHAVVTCLRIVDLWQIHQNPYGKNRSPWVQGTTPRDCSHSVDADSRGNKRESLKHGEPSLKSNRMGFSDEGRAFRKAS
jgi:hypothetical protein